MDSPKRPTLVGRRDMLLGGLMALTSGVAYARRPKPYAPALRQKDLEAIVPKSVGVWRYLDTGAAVLPPADALRDRLYDNLITWAYGDPDGRIVMLVMAYKNVQDGIVQVHRPEVCYPAAGFTLDTERLTVLHLDGHDVPAKGFAAHGLDRTEQVLYFTRLGSRFPLSWMDQRWAVLDANLAGDIPDGLLARVSIIQNDAQSGTQLLAKFFEDLVAAGGAPFRTIMVGAAR